MSVPEKGFQTWMLEAIDAGDLAAVKVLLGQDKEKIAMPNYMGPNWLHYASGHSTLELVRFFLEELRLNPNENHSVGGNSLDCAARNGNTDVVKYLLSSGVEMDERDSTRNPLLAAVLAGSREIVSMLLEAGIDSTVKYELQGAVAPMGAYELAIERGEKDIADLIYKWNLRRAIVN